MVQSPNSLQVVKTKVFILTFGMPILVAIFLLIMLRFESDPFNLFMGILLFIITLGRMLLTDENYIYNFIVNEDNLEIHYLAPF